MTASNIRHNARPAHCGLFVCVALISVVLASDAEAQTPTSPDVGRWDVAFVGGYLAARPDIEIQERYVDNWYSAGQIGLIGGWYFTRHLKAEVEVSTSSEGRLWINRPLTVPGL